MSKFRKEIKTNFTVVHNDFIDDKRLNNDAIGLLLKMLKLPDDWNFSIKGLAAISKDGERKISRQLKELEENGYLVRSRVYVEGKISDWEYIISDEPLPEDVLKQNLKNKPENNINTLVDLHLQNVDVGNEDVQNVDDYKIKNNKIKKDKLFVSQSVENSNLAVESENDSQISRPDMTDRKQIENQLDYGRLIRDHPNLSKQISVVVDILSEVLSDNIGTVRIAKKQIPKAEVTDKLSKLTGRHIIFVLEKLNARIRADPKNKPKNIKAYVLTALYNASDEYDGSLENIFGSPPAEKNYSFDLAEYKSLVNDFLD